MNSAGTGKPSAAALRRRLRSHVARNAGIAAVGLVFSLGLGMAGYHWLAPMPWIDAFLNASMLLGGMGPVDPSLQNDAAKLFAGLYSLYCGIFFIATVGLVIAPIATHVLHRFHLDQRN
jgi:hypothetical protein